MRDELHVWRYLKFGNLGENVARGLCELEWEEPAHHGETAFGVCIQIKTRLGSLLSNTTLVCRILDICYFWMGGVLDALLLLVTGKNKV